MPCFCGCINSISCNLFDFWIMNTIVKTFEQLKLGDTILVPGDPKCTWPQFREDQEWIVEEKYPDKEQVKVKGLGGVVVHMPEYTVKQDTEQQL